MAPPHRGTAIKLSELKICSDSSLSPQLYAGFCCLTHAEAVWERAGERGCLRLASLNLMAPPHKRSHFYFSDYQVVSHDLHKYPAFERFAHRLLD